MNADTDPDVLFSGCLSQSGDEVRGFPRVCQATDGGCWRYKIGGYLDLLRFRTKGMFFVLTYLLVGRLPEDRGMSRGTWTNSMLSYLGTCGSRLFYTQ